MNHMIISHLSPFLPTHSHYISHALLKIGQEIILQIKRKKLNMNATIFQLTASAFTKPKIKFYPTKDHIFTK